MVDKRVPTCYYIRIENTLFDIDGKQHYENAQQIERDKRKNKLLEENGWDLLRINWDDMYSDPKKYIQICKKFIDS